MLFPHSAPKYDALWKRLVSCNLNRMFVLVFCRLVGVFDILLENLKIGTLLLMLSVFLFGDQTDHITVLNFLTNIE